LLIAFRLGSKARNGSEYVGQPSRVMHLSGVVFAAAATLPIPISYLKNKGLFHIDLQSNIIMDMYGRMGSSN